MEAMVPLPEVITPALVAYLKTNYHLKWDGIHGWNHWTRVYENGIYLAKQNGADQIIVSLFAFTHDMARRHEHWDRKHGPHAAELIRTRLQGVFFQLDPHALDLLTQAVELHTEGLVQADITVQTCWDADRLDLGRAGYRPDPKKLCTAEAKDPATIEWAFRRSTAR